MAPAAAPTNPPKRRRGSSKAQAEGAPSSAQAPASQDASASAHTHEALQGEETFTIFSKGQLMQELEAKYGEGAEAEDEGEAILKACASQAAQPLANGGTGRRARGRDRSARRARGSQSRGKRG